MSITSIMSPGPDLAALPRFARHESIEVRGVRFWVIEIAPTRLVLATGIDPALEPVNAASDQRSLERIRARNRRLPSLPPIGGSAEA